MGVPPSAPRFSTRIVLQPRSAAPPAAPSPAGPPPMISRVSLGIRVLLVLLPRGAGPRPQGAGPRNEPDEAPQSEPQPQARRAETGTRASGASQRGREAYVVYVERPRRPRTWLGEPKPEARRADTGNEIG